MRIRKFRKADAWKVSRLIRRTLFEVNIKDYSRKILERIAKWNSPSELIRRSKVMDIYVAVEGNRVIGTTNIEKNRIGATFVNPSYHGMGAGKLLIEHVEKAAKRKRIKKLLVPASVTAWRFYEKLGYKKKNVMMTKSGRVIVMEKKL